MPLLPRSSTRLFVCALLKDKEVFSIERVTALLAEGRELVYASSELDQTDRLLRAVGDVRARLQAALQKGHESDALLGGLCEEARSLGLDIPGVLYSRRRS